MHSILVTVDDTPSCVAARELALSLARQSGASIRGVTGVDLSDIDRVELAPIGGAGYAYARLQRRNEQSEHRRARIAELPEAFQRSLAAEGMEAACHTMESDVRGELLHMVETCDLVVTGRDAEFRLEPLEGVAPLVEYVIARGCRPVIVTGPDPVGNGPVLVGYDGSAPAAKALQAAGLLGIFGSAAVHVVSVCRDRAEASGIADRARQFLKPYGVSVDIDPVGSSDRPDEILLKRASDIDARMLVMGAFGHRGLRDILFGSSTQRLFEAAPLPLFIYH
jgi:nucleotide-binding universal stress UspA family protein